MIQSNRSYSKYVSFSIHSYRRNGRGNDYLLVGQCRRTAFYSIRWDNIGLKHFCSRRSIFPFGEMHSPFIVRVTIAEGGFIFVNTGVLSSMIESFFSLPMFCTMVAETRSSTGGLNRPCLMFAVTRGMQASISRRKTGAKILVRVLLFVKYRSMIKIVSFAINCSH